MMTVVTMVLFLLAASSFCLAAETGKETTPDKQNSVIVEKERGLIDWSQNYIEATGMAVNPTAEKGAQGKALARRGAIVDLQRNLLEFVVGVQVDSRTTMDDFWASDRVKSEVHGMVRNVEIMDGTWDGESYTVSGRIRLPQVLVIVEPECREKQAATPKPKTNTKPSSTKGRYTGLVIDVRHLPLVPTLTFRVMDASGHEVYGISYTDPVSAAQSGLGAYYNNIEYARGEIRVAANPIVTKALRLASDNYDIVIPDDAAAKVRGSSYDFRRECKVILVVK
jgi:hypothetical protein